MRIIFLPLYFTPLLVFIFGLVLIVGIYSFVKVYRLFKLKQIGNIELIVGLIISITLYGLLNFIYPEEKETFSIIFVGPFLLIFLPLILHFVTKNIKKEEFLSKVSLVAITYSMVGIVLKMIFNSFYS
ncbi:MAG: hypothetical protein ABJO28_06175 [Maribacter dokdonensis]|uniref:hypothetical protein n=1 Tax=Maribacter dokdonensis TaxID=320912 RepID=UPI003299E6EE